MIVPSAVLSGLEPYSISSSDSIIVCQDFEILSDQYVPSVYVSRTLLRVLVDLPMESYCLTAERSSCILRNQTGAFRGDFHGCPCLSKLQVWAYRERRKY